MSIAIKTKAKAKDNPFKVEILPITPDQFTFLKEYRSDHWIKEYVHRWMDYNGVEVFMKFRRKHNRTKIEVAYHQHLVDEMKPYFGLTRMGTRVVEDPKEGIGVMQIWAKNNLGTMKQPQNLEKWVCEKKLLEVLRICFFDGIIGGLDRHGNNVIVTKDVELLTIDDEDVFYSRGDKKGDIRVWIKFEQQIKRMVYGAHMKNPTYFPRYVDWFLKNGAPTILQIGDCDVMRGNETYKFYEVLENNVRDAKDIANETIRQLIL